MAIRCHWWPRVWGVRLSQVITGSEKRSFQEQLRETKFSRAVKKEMESLGAGSEKRSFSQKVLGDFFKSHDSARRLHGYLSRAAGTERFAFVRHLAVARLAVCVSCTARVVRGCPHFNA